MPIVITRRLAFDPVTRRCDRAFNGTTTEIETTPATALMLAVGLDRRAHDDDQLPDVPADAYTPPRMDVRRGSPLDFLDPVGRLLGSRLWLYLRRKQDEATRRGVESALQEAIEPLAQDRGWQPAITVRWTAPNILRWTVDAGNVTLSLAAGLA